VNLFDEIRTIPRLRRPSSGPAPAKEMNDQHDYADHEKKVNKATGDVERQEGNNPNGEEDKTQQQE
jgi:hypothetical protein